MDRPNSFITSQVDENESNTSDKKWRVLYYVDRQTNKHKKHPFMDNFEILKEENEELKKRVETLEKQVEKLTLRSGSRFF